MAETQPLTAEIVEIAYGTILFSTGLALVVLGAAFRSARSYEVPAFGAAILLHGIRALGDIEAVRLASGLPDAVFDYSGPICLYFVSAAAYIFLEQYWGSGLWNSFRRIWQFHLVFAVVATAVDLYTANPGHSMEPYGVLVVVYRVVLVVNLVTGSLKTRPEDVYVLYGFGIVVLCTIHDVLVTAGVLEWTARARPLGVLAFMAGLGYSILLRARANQRQLGTLSTQLRTARQIQQSLLPPESVHPSTCRHAVRYIPMEAVGGDFYDFVPIDEHRFAVLVADVTGHGIPAALIASMLKTAAAAQSRIADDPAEVVHEINQRLHDQLDAHLVTVVYAVVDTQAGRIAIANAGHPPPLLRRRGASTVREIGIADAAIGLLADERYGATRMALEPGDRLLFYTDGVTEAASPSGRHFSVEQVKSTLRERPDVDLESWADYLLEKVRRWTGRPTLTLDDDLTLVAIDIP